MAAQLESWDFQDAALNSTTSLINRQKSANKLLVLVTDGTTSSGIFSDGDGTQNHATLHYCDCHDFSFVGRSPRKKLQPCMHIYRLAMELGLLESHYLDHKAREALQRSALGQLKQSEDDRLRELTRDRSAWGGWSREVHRAGVQLNRQYRAYFLVDDEQTSTLQAGSDWQVRDYLTALDDCSCPDFQERQLPCKHVYSIAVLQGLAIGLSRGEYEAARQRGQEIVFEFPAERPDPLDRF